MNTASSAAPGATVDSLLAAYVRALDLTEDVPPFSLWRYAIPFGELIRWEFACLVLVFVSPVLVLIRFCLRPFGVNMPLGPMKGVRLEFRRPFDAIWRGDISALQAVQLRALTRAFIGAHIAGVVEQLKLRAERKRLDALMSGATAENLTPIETDLRKLEGLTTIAKSQNPLSAVVATGSASALPLALAKLLVPAALKLLPGDVADQIGAFVPLGQMLKAIGLAGDETVPLTPVLLAVGGGFLTFLLITAMSCHIEKQRILAAAGVHNLEVAVLPPQISSFTMPLDVAFAAGAAASGFLTIYFFASLTMTEPDRSDQMFSAVLALAVSLLVAIIVVVRRLYLQLLPRAKLWPMARLGLLRTVRRAP